MMNGRAARTEVWESRHVPTCLGRLRVRIGGSDARATGKAPMMFWPSLLMDGAMWNEVASHFAQRRGARVVLVDAPGHGQSEELTRGFTFDECAQCVVQMLDALEVPKVVFVGNSWGGMIGGTFTAQHPERAAASVLMNCTASAAGLRQKAEFFALTRIARILGGVRGPLVGRVIRAFLGPTTLRERPEVAQTIREALDRVHIASSILATECVVPRRPDQHALLGTIRTPVLVVAGEEDPTFSLAETRRMADAIPGAQFHMMPRTGHLAGLERPEEVCAVIDGFLERASLG